MIKHTIRTQSGKTRNVRLTPLSATRTFCRECMGWNYNEVEKCTAPLCPLYPFRNPKQSKGTKKVSQKSIDSLIKSGAKRRELKKMVKPIPQPLKKEK